MSKYLQGRFKPNFPEKYKGDPTNIIYRSSWEFKFLVWLDTNSNVEWYSSEEIVIPYWDPVMKRPRRYFPDMVFKSKTSDGSSKVFMVEIKPSKFTKEPVKKSKVTKTYVKEMYMYKLNMSKWEFAKRFCADKGWTFAVITEREIYGENPLI